MVRKPCFGKGEEESWFVKLCPDLEALTTSPLVEWQRNSRKFLRLHAQEGLPEHYLDSLQARSLLRVLYFQVDTCYPQPWDLLMTMQTSRVTFGRLQTVQA